MSKLNQYIQAATRDNTRRSYQSAIRHFEIEWGGFLPASANSVARYLADHADLLAINTLRQRLAALAQWHIDQGFPDPTKAPVVRKVFRGIQKLHPSQEKRAKPLQMEQLGQVTHWLDEAIKAARVADARADELRCIRDKAILLLGFWRGFRGDELTRLEVEYVEVVHGEGMTCYFPQTKGDRQFKGTFFKVPALSQLCPVAAYTAWIELADLHDGPAFRSVDQWGHVGAVGLNADSLIPLLRSLFTNAGVESPLQYSGHSLRRGFANWATAHGWDLKTLMEYVGWKNVQSAMRYVESADPFAKDRIESMLKPTTNQLPASIPAPMEILKSSIQRVQLDVTLSMKCFSKHVRTLKKAHALIEEFCFVPHRMRRMDKQGHRYQLQISCEHSEQLEEIVADMLDEMHRIASGNRCFIEVSIHNVLTGKFWN